MEVTQTRKICATGLLLTKMDGDRIMERRASALGKPLFLGMIGLVAALVGVRTCGISVSSWALGASLGALLALIGVGVWWQPSGIFARPLLGVQTPRPELALTFDDGPNPDLTPGILDALEARGHRGTFFVIGRQAEKHPELLKEIVVRGHGLANHSFAHAWFTNLLPPALLAEELRRTSSILSQASGKPLRFFRAPVGLLSPRVSKAATLAGLDIVAWTASARDGVPWRTVEEGILRLSPYLVRGAILVMHDGVRAGGRPAIALPILEVVLDGLEKEGLHSVTLEQLLRS